MMWPRSRKDNYDLAMILVQTFTIDLTSDLVETGNNNNILKPNCSSNGAQNAKNKKNKSRGEEASRKPRLVRAGLFPGL